MKNTLKLAYVNAKYTFYLGYYFEIPADKGREGQDGKGKGWGGEREIDIP